MAPVVTRVEHAATLPIIAEAELAGLSVDSERMVRLQENPHVFVLLFPSLEMQGAAFNRLAALVEKAGLPRDRLLPDAELAEAIARNGDQAATWYYGHDYAGEDVGRLERLAERDAINLNEAEKWVIERFHQARTLVDPKEEIALISVANANWRADQEMHRTILHHEIAHGHFFTHPAVATHVLRIWRTAFAEYERGAIRQFLGREGYDIDNERLVANEAMAYLLFTPDVRFFSARHLGLPEAMVDLMRGRMRDGFPQL